jgi:tetratricopeptide (TPR) repeat protein
MERQVRVRRWAFIVVVVLLVSVAGRAVAEPGAPTLDDLRKYQDQLLKAGEKERVLGEFRERVKKEETAINRFLLGRLLFKLKEFAKARSEFDRALELDPLCGPACQGMALCLVKDGEYEQAIRRLKQAITLDPKDDTSRLLLADVLAGTGDHPGAIKLLGAFLDKKPAHIAARFLLGQIHFRARSAEKARDEFKALLFHDKTFIPARKALVLCYQALKDFTNAEAELRKIVTLAPKDLEAYLRLADVLLQMRRLPEARAIFEKLLESDLPADIKKQVQEQIDLIDQAGASLTVVKLLERLAAKLKDKNPAVRRAAMGRLATIDFNRVPRIILEHIVDTDVGVRVLVARIVGMTGDDASVPVLALKLRHPRDRDESKLVRGACAEALGKIPAPATVPILLTVLGDKDPYVIELALLSLRGRTGLRFSKDDAATAVEKSLDDVRQAWWRWWRSDKAVVWKLNAIESIKKLESKALVSYLVPLMEDQKVEIFAAAYKAFTALTVKSFGKVKDDPKDRARVAKLAREWWKAGGR